MDALFHDRRTAGLGLAQRLREYGGREDVVVLALPRGGVPVGAEIARALGAPLDLALVRKLGVPGQEELAFGAIALPGVVVFNREVLTMTGLGEAEIDEIIAAERNELNRRNAVYRGGARMPGVAGHIIILVDDGMATGADMEAAVVAASRTPAARIVVAAPVASREACARIAAVADEVVCLMQPEIFTGVGSFYECFPQTSDEEVMTLLAKARQPGTGAENRFAGGLRA